MHQGSKKIELRGKQDQHWEQSRSDRSKHAQCKNGLRAVQKHKHFYHSEPFCKRNSIQKIPLSPDRYYWISCAKGSHLYPWKPPKRLGFLKLRVLKLILISQRVLNIVVDNGEPWSQKPILSHQKSEVFSAHQTLCRPSFYRKKECS